MPLKKLVIGFVTKLSPHRRVRDKQESWLSTFGKLLIFLWLILCSYYRVVGWGVKEAGWKHE